MSDFTCPVCEQTFDDDQRQPRMIDCGHTICSLCLTVLIEQQHSDPLMCPEDGEILTNFKPEKGINSFPINKVLLRKSKKIVPERPEKKEMGTRITNFNSLNICYKHNKMREIVCQTDAIVICSDCAFSPEHKNHDLLNNENFVMFLNDKLKTFTQNFELLESKPFFGNKEEIIENLEIEIVKKKKQIFFEIQEIFDNFQGAIFQKQKRLIEEIETRFTSILEKFNNLQENVKKSSNTKNDIVLKIRQIEDFVSKIDLDHTISIDNCCKKPGLEEIINDFSKELDFLLITSEEQIQKSLKKIKIELKQEEFKTFLEKCVIFQTIDLENNSKVQKCEIKIEPNQEKTQKSETQINNENSPLVKIDEKKKEEIIEDDKNQNANLLAEKTKSMLHPKTLNRNGKNSSTKPELANPQSHTKLSKNPENRFSKNPQMKLDNSFNDDELLDISADNLNISASILESDSLNKSHLSRSILDENIDYSDISGLNDSISDKNEKSKNRNGRRKKHDVLKKNDGNNSFIKTRENSPIEDRLEENQSNSHLIMLEPEIQQKTSMTLENKIKIKSSRSNNEILSSFVQAKMDKQKELESKKISSANSFLGGKETMVSQKISLANGHFAQPKFLQTVSSRVIGTPISKICGTVQGIEEEDVVGPKSLTPMLNNLEKMNQNSKVDLDSHVYKKNSLKAKPIVKLGSSDDAGIEINLVNKRINDSTLSLQFGDILKSKKAKVLNLSANFITEVGVGSLIKNLASHPSIEKIILRENYIGENIFTLLRNSAQILKKIRHFDILDNQEKIDRGKIKTEVTNLRKLNIFLEINSK